MAKPILIVGALENEVSGLKKALSRERDVGSVIIVHTGIGEEATRQSLERHLQAHDVAAVIGVGYAGALVENLNTGDLIVADEICQANSGETVLSDRGLLTAALKVLPGVRRGCLVTVHAACTDARQKKATGDRHHAIAVDMESATLASLCRDASKPFLVLRSILDPLEASVPDPSAFMDASQSVSKKKLVTYMVKNPKTVWQLPQLALHAKRARHSLTNAIVSLLKELKK